MNLNLDVYRLSVSLDALLSAVQRIRLHARNGGSLAQIERECDSVEEFVSAVNRAQSQDGIAQLVAGRNAI